MHVFVVGANGQIGRYLVKLLIDSNDHSVKAMVRKEEQASEFKEMGADTAVVDLEGDAGEIAESAKGCDAIVFTAGSGGKTGYDKTLLIDLDGAVKTMEAAEKAGVKRFVMVSALQANNRKNWNEAIKPYYVAKHYADIFLESTDLNYTIVRPGGLLNETGTGKVSVGDKLGRGSVPREDVAKVVVASLDEENTYKRAFDLVSGETPINKALKNI
ncbi:SDR family oxidoreductase [Pseudalkalibacillus caeni]|uniref:SDR family oxidoreductase n=1 Tax=Exobacillus caeni TaxID=2574798 RepID=A0A5R9F5H2_9BACL|nr:SDR family oxidoreductase [Pseudalkalibacillus caeni]TLS35055.1 SDR family oxidoreductase [Pseudalkalibacillus caeni]